MCVQITCTKCKKLIRNLFSEGKCVCVYECMCVLHFYRVTNFTWYVFHSSDHTYYPGSTHIHYLSRYYVLLFFFFVAAHRLYRLLFHHYHDTTFNGFGIPQRNQHQCMGDLKDNRTQWGRRSFNGVQTITPCKFQSSKQHQFTKNRHAFILKQ
jgi:hypothetical protein